MSERIGLYCFALLVAADGATAGALNGRIRVYNLGSGATMQSSQFRLQGTIADPGASGVTTAGDFGGGAGFWWVRVGQEPGEIVGDMNCDGFVTVGDISGFVLALTDPAQYATTYPDCDIQNADVNGDGFVSVGDIGAFVELLTGVSR